MDSPVLYEIGDEHNSSCINLRMYTSSARLDPSVQATHPTLRGLAVPSRCDTRELYLSYLFLSVILNFLHDAQWSLDPCRSCMVAHVILITCNALTAIVHLHFRVCGNDEVSQIVIHNQSPL